MSFDDCSAEPEQMIDVKQDPAGSYFNKILHFLKMTFQQIFWILFKLFEIFRRSGLPAKDGQIQQRLTPEHFHREEFRRWRDQGLLYRAEGRVSTGYS